MPPVELPRYVRAGAGRAFRSRGARGEKVHVRPCDSLLWLDLERGADSRMLRASGQHAVNNRLDLDELSQSLNQVEVYATLSRQPQIATLYDRAAQAVVGDHRLECSH